MHTPDPASRTDNRRHQIRVLPKALGVLESIVFDGPSTLTNLTRSTGADKAAVYRILNTFEASEYVVKDNTTKKYGPGPKLISLAHSILESVDLVQATRPYLLELVEQFGETVNLGTLIGGQIHYLDVIDSQHNLRMSRRPGMRDHIHSTALGKAILSTLPSDTAEKLLRSVDLERVTQRTLVEIPALLDEIESVRQLGYAIDDQENDIGAVCIAAPIVGLPRGELAAVSVSGPAARMTGPAVMRIAEGLKRVVKELSVATSGTQAETEESGPVSA